MKNGIIFSFQDQVSSNPKNEDKKWICFVLATKKDKQLLNRPGADVLWIS